MKLLIFSCLLLALALCQASVIPAGPAVAIPVGAPAVPLPPTSYQFVTRNYNGYYVPTQTTWPAYSPYPNTYYKYSGGYPGYSYPYSYAYGYYPSYNYGYGYKSVW